MKGFYKIFKRKDQMQGIWNPIKVHLILLAFLCVGIKVSGQTFVSNTGAATTGGNAIPWSTSFGDFKGEFVYYPGDLSPTPTKGGYIKTVYVRPNSNAVSSSTFTNLMVQIAQVSPTFSLTGSNFYTPISTCLAANTTLALSAGTWMPIKLTTPFSYDPSKAIIVIFSFSGYTGTGFTAMTKVSTVTGNHRMYAATQTATTAVGTDATMNDFGFDVAPAGADNAGITNLISPVAFCPGTYGIQVKAANLGINDLSSVNIGWSYDGVTQSSISWPYKIPVGRDTNITLGTKTFAANVNHILKVWTTLPNGVKDTTPNDDTLLIKNLIPAISGTFTINPGGGTGGTNFTSFTSAANFLNASGICGPVLIKVSPGTYTEQVTLNAVLGSSSTNTITFDGQDSSKTILTTNSVGDAFKLNGSSYVTIKRMSIFNNSVASPSFAVHITNVASYITVNNCIIKCDTNTTVAGVTPLGLCGSTYSTTDGVHHCTINNNIISGGYITISCFGSGNTATPTPGNIFTNNKITRASQYGMYFEYERDYSISNNTILVRPNSATASYGMYVYYCANGVINANVISANYCGIYANYSDYYATGKISLITNNFIYGQYYTSTGGYGLYTYYGINSIVQHNTIYYTGTYYGLYVYNTGTATQGTDVRNNIIYKTNSTAYNLYVPATTYVSNLDYNDYWNPAGGTFAYLGSAYSDLPSLQKAVPTMNQNSVNADPGFANLTYGTENLHMATTSFGVSGIYGGIDKDIDGDSRCKLFPNMGADEVLTGKGKPNVKFFLTSNIYPGSPSYVYQTYKAGSPTKNAWYIKNSTYGSYTKISDSVVLLTNKFTVGANCLKLITQTCGGIDSFIQCFNVVAPTSVPGTDFVANKNSIIVNDIVSFQDLSSNGPQSWNWKVSPDSTIFGGTKVPAIKYTFGSVKYQNPQIQFLYPGKYQVCLTTTNGVGKGATVCKKDYITVLPSVNLGTKVVTNAQGFLYDDGGPNAGYVNAGGTPSTLIQPCADSVYLVFTMFDLNCNISFLQIYEGVDAKGKRLDPCGGSGVSSGFTGGPSGASCSSPCMPNVTKPDTFKAKTSMFIQMNDGTASANAKGFAAYWWSKPSSSKKPKASFTAAGTGDSICVNSQINFTNTTPNTNPADPVSILWDLDGDNTTYECIGACKTAFWPYFLAGPTTVTMIATSCGGSDTFVKTLMVYNPKTPKTAIKADNTTPTTAEVVFFTAPIVQCVDDYVWTFTKSAGSGSGTANYANGTTSISAAPQVIFSDTGYYDVTLAVDNLAGLQKDALTLKKYIHVRNPYCIPSVATLNQGMGISNVSINTINNSMTQASQEYTNFTANQNLSTSLAVGATYPISISRNSNLVFENLNRSVFIDWNGDGLFTGKGEEAAEDSNTNTVTWSGKITVPKTAKLGATVMRVVVNRGAYSNKPCGQNEFGEYQDYRIYVVPYNILPVITLKGQQGLKDTIKIEQGNAFTDPGYSASSFLYGNITSNVIVTSKLNIVIPGIYLLSYNVADSAGNKAITQYRVIQITKDNTPPVLIVATPDTTYMEVTGTPLNPFPAPAVISADDLVDGPLAASVVNDANKVTSNIVGTYIITYSVTDLTGNTATVYRVVQIIDTIRPVLKLIGGSPITMQVNTSFVDPGYTVSDNYYSASELNPLVLIGSTLDTAKLGTYLLTYDLTDKSGNKAATVTRVVVVVDTDPPTISLNGAQFDSVDVFKKYDDASVTYADNYNKLSDVSLVVTGTYYAKFPVGSKANLLGVYTIIYTVTDKSGNSASVTRTVKVVDHVAPVLALIGPATVTVCRWFNYVDAGCTVTDNYDKTSDINIDTFSSGNTMVDGLFSVRYKGTDKSGNIGYSDYRYILVKPAGSATCLSAIEQGLNLDKYINVYPNPNNGMFTINANLPSAENVRMSVTNMLGQEIAVVHNGMLNSGSFQVDLGSQASGIYLLNIVSNNQTLTKRIEITR